jgi:hypothetical protein
MPFLNGKFYMNPAYGRAVERARASEAVSAHDDSQQQGQGDHWVTIDHRHVLIQETQAGRAQHKAQLHSAQRREVIRIYNEYSGLRPKPGATTRADLTKARENAAHVYDNVHGRGFQGSSSLGPQDARDIRNPKTDASKYYQDTQDAVTAAAKESDTTQNANHVYIYDP